MTRHIMTLAAAGAMAGLAVPAMAAGPAQPLADPVVMAPAPAPVVTTDWTGPYLGAQLGWGSLGADDGAGVEIDDDGVVGGLTAGYLHDFGQFVLGGEAQYDWTGIEDEAAGGELENIGRLKAIAGFDAGRTLIYGSAGWATASLATPAVDYDGDGWLVGAGVDYLLNETVTVGGEVMRHQFDDLDDSGIDADVTTVQAKMTFRF